MNVRGSVLEQALARAMSELEQLEADYQTAKSVYDADDRGEDFEWRWRARIDRVADDIRALRGELSEELQP